MICLAVIGLVVSFYLGYTLLWEVTK